MPPTGVPCRCEQRRDRVATAAVSAAGSRPNQRGCLGSAERAGTIHHWSGVTIRPMAPSPLTPARPRQTAAVASSATTGSSPSTSGSGAMIRRTATSRATTATEPNRKSSTARTSDAATNGAPQADHQLDRRDRRAAASTVESARAVPTRRPHGRSTTRRSRPITSGSRTSGIGFLGAGRSARTAAGSDHGRERSRTARRRSRRGRRRDRSPANRSSHSAGGGRSAPVTGDARDRSMRESLRASRRTRQAMIASFDDRAWRCSRLRCVRKPERCPSRSRRSRPRCTLSAATPMPDRSDRALAAEPVPTIAASVVAAPAMAPIPEQRVGWPAGR